jgi:hypothetical protein
MLQIRKGENMQKVKTELAYLLYFVTLIVLIPYMLDLLAYFHMRASSNFDMSSYMIAMTLMSFTMGIYLGIPHIINQMKRRGQWQINWIRLLCLGFPFFTFSVAIVMYFILQVNFLNNIVIYVTGQYLREVGMISITILGFVLIKSIKKSSTH